MVVDIDGNAVIIPKEPFYCPFCGKMLILHDFIPAMHKYPDGRPDLRHCDVHMKCPGCGFWVTFGVPITIEECERLSKSKYKVVTLRWELKEIYEKLGINVDEMKIVEERLRTLGYW